MDASADSRTSLPGLNRLTQRVHFEGDGTISIATGKVELGQGILTALAQIAAEELGVPLDKIRMLPPSTAYSPDEDVTSGSLSIELGGQALRRACAQKCAGQHHSHPRIFLQEPQAQRSKVVRVVGRSSQFWEALRSHRLRFSRNASIDNSTKRRIAKVSRRSTCN